MKIKRILQKILKNTLKIRKNTRKKTLKNTPQKLDPGGKITFSNYDWTFSFPLLNGMFQPIVYIFSFQRLREVFVKVICCEQSKNGKRTVRVLSIFQGSHKLSGNFVDMDNTKGGLTLKPKSVLKENPEIPDSRKCSAVSRISVLSDDEQIGSKSQTSFSLDNKESVSNVKSNNDERINSISL